MKEIHKINEVQDLFPHKYMAPEYVPGELCDCDHEYNSDVSLGDCESTKVFIHHSKTTRDSRNSCAR